MTEKAPRPDNFDSVEFADSVKELTPRNSLVLGKTALEYANNIQTSSKRMEALQNMGAPDLILDDARDYLNRWIDCYVGEEYDVEKEIREPLATAPDIVKETQNIIFSNLIRKDEKNFVLNTIKPKEYDLRNTQRYLLGVLGLESRVPATYYDFAEKLTEKNEDKDYTVPDETVKNFVSWYQAEAKLASEEIVDAMKTWYLESYEDNLNRAIEYNILPKPFKNNLERLKPDSEHHIDLSYGVIDAVNAYRTIGGEEFFLIGGHCQRESLFNRKEVIRLGIDNDSRDWDAVEIFYHELTHAISGDAISFDGNREASRIINEGLTESIAAKISSMNELGGIDEEYHQEVADEIAEEVGTFGGKAYKIERSVLGYLQSGGKNNINPDEFFEAYAETDELYELLRDDKYYDLPFDKNREDSEDMPEYDAFLKNPYRTYGPAQQKLINSLLESFPECKDLAGLGEMIVEKFKQFKEATSESND